MLKKLCSKLTFLFLLILLSLTVKVWATDYTYSDSGWDTTPNFGNFQNTDKLIFNADYEFTTGQTIYNGSIEINEGKTLTFSGSPNTINCSINNKGNIVISSGASVLFQSGTFSNSSTGTITNNGTTTISQAFTNVGTINNNAGSLILTNDITNNGSITNEAGATITGSTINNGEDSNHTATIENKGTLTAGTLNNYATITNDSSGSIFGNYNINNKSGGTITNNGNLTSTTNPVDNAEGGTITSPGTITGDVTNNGSMDITGGAVNGTLGGNNTPTGYYPPATYTWTGAVDSDWTNPTNWSSSPAVTNGYPGKNSGDNVKINCRNNDNNINVPEDITITNMNIEGTKLCTITIEGGKKLNITGLLTLGDKVPLLMGMTGKVQFAGSGTVIIEDMDASTSTLDPMSMEILSPCRCIINGNLLTVTGIGDFNLTGNGTIEFNGTQAGDNHPHIDSFNGIIDGTAKDILINSATPITYEWKGLTTEWNEKTNWSGNFIPSSTSDVTLPADLSNYPILSADVTVKSITFSGDPMSSTDKEATLDLNGKNLTVTDGWYISSNENFIYAKGTETVDFSGVSNWTSLPTGANSGGQWVYTGTGNIINYNNTATIPNQIIFETGSEITLTNDVEVADKYFIKSGAKILLNGYKLVANGNAAWENKGTFVFDTQDIPVLTYGTASTEMPYYSVEVTSGKTAAIPATIKIQKDFTDSGTVTASPGEGIIFIGDGSVSPTQTFTGSSGSNYGNLIIGDGTNVTTVTISGDVTATSITIKENATLKLENGSNLTLSGDFTNNGTFIGTDSSGGGTVIFTDTATITTGSSASITFYNLSTNSSSVTLTVDGDISVNNELTNKGIIDIETNTISLKKYAGSGTTPPTDKISATTGTVSFTGTSAATIGTVELAGGQISTTGAALTIDTLTLSTAEATLNGGTNGITITDALNGGDLLIEGKITLNGEIDNLNFTNSTDKLIANNNITINGEWNNTVNADFTYNTYSVTFTGTKSSPNLSIINGNNTFYSLILQADTIFEAEKTTTATNSITANGTDDTDSSRLSLSSSDSSKTWNLDISSVSESNRNLSNLSIINSISTDVITVAGSKDLGNNVNWNFSGFSYKWNSTSSTDKNNWNNKENWLPASIPGKNAKVTIPSQASGEYPILTTTSLEIETLIVDENAQIDINGCNIQTDNFTLNGKCILTGGETFTQLSGVGTNITKAFGSNSELEFKADSSTKHTLYSNFFQTDNTVTTVSINKITIDSGADIIFSTDDSTGVTKTTITTLVNNGNLQTDKIYEFTNLTNNNEVKITEECSITNLTNNKQIDVTNKTLTITNYTGDTAATPTDKITVSATAKTIFKGNSATTITNIELSGGTFENQSTAALLTISNFNINASASEDSTLGGGTKGITITNELNLSSSTLNTQGAVSFKGKLDKLNVKAGTTTTTGALTIQSDLNLLGELSLSENLTTKNITFEKDSNTPPTTGTLTASAATTSITISGDWDNTNGGTFTHNNKTVTFTGTATTVNGTTAFYDATFNAPVTIEAANTFHDATFNSSATLKEANTFNDATFKNTVAFDNSNTFANLTFTENASGEITTKQTVSGLLKITTASTKNLSLSATDNDFANPVQIGTYDESDPANPTHTETGIITLGGSNLQIAANAYAKQLTLNTPATLNGNVTTTNSQEYKATTIPPSTEIKLTTTATATNTINFGGDISGGSKLTINAPAVISDDVKFTTPQIVFGKTLDDTTAGAHSLTLGQTGTAVEVTFNGKIGTTTPLKSLICYGTTNINTQSVTTSEVQQYAILNIQQSTTLSAPGTAASGITFTGNVTGKDANTELTIKNANSTWGTSTPKIYVTNFKDLIFINDSPNNYSLNATYANMISNSIPVYFYGNETTAAAGIINFNPGATIYSNISVEKHANLNFTGDFEQNVNNSTTTPTFLIDGANVTLGETAFIVDYLKVQNGGHFTQTGNNGNDSNDASTKKHSVYKMENTVENGIIWNKDNTDPDEGGSLIIKYGTIENADTPILYFLKKIDLWANTITLKGTFWNLIIPSGVEVHNSDYICVRNNFTIENTGKYIHEGKRLTLGTNLSDSGLNSAPDNASNGNFKDENSAANNLGDVTINAPGITKRSDTNSNFLCTNLTITSGSTFAPDSDWNVEITGNFTDNGTINLVSTPQKLIFDGNTPSEILPNKNTTYPYIEINKTAPTDSTNPIPNVTIKADTNHDELKVTDITVSIPSNADFTVEGKLSNTNSTITNCQKTELKNTVNCKNFKISNWSSLIFDDNTTITDFETPGTGNAGNIIFHANTTITNDTTFNTTGTVAFGDSTTDDDFTFGASITHTAGSTILKGDLTANNTITFAGTTIDGTITANDSIIFGNTTVNGTVTSQNSSITCGDTTIIGSVNAKTEINLGNTNVTGSIESQDSSITLADTTVNGTITANDSITLANTTVSGTITSTASSIETDKLTLTGNSSVIAKTDITINDSISGRDYNLTLDSPAQITLTSSDTNKLILKDSGTPAVPTSSIVINGGEIKTQEMLEIPFNTTLTAATTLSVKDDGTGSLILPSIITIDLTNEPLTINAYTQLHGKFTSSTNSPNASITINNDAIINNTSNTTEINVPLTCQNLVVYNGELKTSANITTTKDLLFYGTNYNEKDQCSNIDNIYTYTNRFANTQFNKTKLPDNVTDISTLFTAPPSFTGTLTTVGGITINSAHNFYANGLTATGDSDWNLKLKSNRNTIQNFADAFYCDFTASPCLVSCNNSTNAGDLCIAAEACTVKTGYENNWDLDDFEISHAYTVHDNLIIIQFNRNLRFIDNELADTSKVQRIKYFNGTSESSYQVVITNDNLAAPVPLEASMNPSDSIYLCACTTSTALSTGIWNSDASGIFAGYPASKDTHKIHQNAIPYLNIPRNAYNSDGTTVDYAFFITDEYGKRLLHYFNATPSSTEKSENGETYTNVKDRSCPVLIGIKIGQEQYSDYDETIGESSQHSYDSHNFIEFTYSESVNFGSQDPAVCDIWIPAYDATQNDYVVENVRVSSKLGALIGDITKEGKLVFAGLGSIANGKIHTGKNGTIDTTVNAFYRDNPFSIRLSIAGWTDGTVTDRDGNEFKNWAGYIESAVMPSGNYALELTSSLVTDLYGNTQKASVETVTVDNSDNGTYGLWDLSEPVFAPCRLSKSTDWGNKTQSEAVGAGSGSTLDRIEFHLFDNSPLYDTTDSAFWFTQKGWCESISSTTLKDVDYTYCADIIGGSRPYEPVARRTKGGIRYSTKANNPHAFKYSTSKSANPDSSFITTISGVYSTTTSTIFTGSSSPRRSNTDPDGLYIGLGLPETNLPVETTFTVSYDDSTGFLTDLAGNRLRSDIINTIDRTPPSIDLCLSELNKDELLVIFVKELNTDSSSLKFVDQTGTPIPITHSFEQILPYCFEIIQLDSNGNPAASSDLKIDTSKAAKIEIRNPATDSTSKSTFTFITLKLNRTLTLKDLQTLHIRLRNAPQYPEKTRDPITSIDNSRVTFIQDTIGNYTSMYTAHSLSDFIIGGITPLYAYDADMTYNSESIMDGFYEEGSWAVHDWEAEQQNYGKLPANHPISLVVSLDDGTAQKDNLPANARVYLANSPDAASIATQFNADFNHKLRVWLPDVTNGLFPGFALSNNTNYAQTDSELLTDNLKDGLIFNISKDITTKWNNNDQISFLFGLLNPDKTPMRIYNAPYFNVTTNTYDFSRSTAVPLYSMRLHDPTDILSLELWSFRVRSITEQRAGVTILNNVINSDKGEKTVVKVNMPSEGKLSVMVMTLDGNIVQYLTHGDAAAGEHYYAWDGKNKNGKAVARGMYFIRIVGNGIDETRKVMVVK